MDVSSNVPNSEAVDAGQYLENGLQKVASCRQNSKLTYELTS